MIFRVAILVLLVSTLDCPLPPPSDWWGVLSDSRTVSTVVWSLHLVCLACLSICLSDMRGGSLLLFFCSCFIFSPPLRSDRGRFSRLLFFFLSFSSFVCVFLDVAMVWKGKPASVCDHGFERSDLCAEIIIIIIIKQQLQGSCARVRRIQNARRRNHLRMVRGGAQTHTRSAAAAARILRPGPQDPKRQAS